MCSLLGSSRRGLEREGIHSAQTIYYCALTRSLLSMCELRFSSFVVASFGWIRDVMKYTPLLALPNKKKKRSVAILHYLSTSAI